MLRVKTNFGLAVFSRAVCKLFVSEKCFSLDHRFSTANVHNYESLLDNGKNHSVSWPIRHWTTIKAFASCLLSGARMS